MTPAIILPGLDGSGEGHWQTLWQARDPAMVRFAPKSWDKPDLADWIAALDRAVARAAEPPLLIAHSLACLLVPLWAATAARPIRGAFLVAPPDPDAPEFPPQLAPFRAVPDKPLPFPALVIASTDDPYGTIDHAKRRAKAWRAGLVAAGALGHINLSSGHGKWPQGLALFEAFAAGTRRA